jgi:5'-methylthioadenosine phosphorylase
MEKIAIIGGSGLENPDILHHVEELKIETPYGIAEIKTGTIDGAGVALLSRHGKHHTITPTHVNNRANIWAIKKIGCRAILATTACGSLREEIGRGDLVFPNQFIDFTKQRATTFFDSFEPDKMAHTPMADPFDERMRNQLILSAKEIGLKFHSAGTVVTIEGPRFSTRAESNMFRFLGADVINMSTAPECILANELQIPYAAVAMSTDYDCWKTDEAPVTWEEVLKVFALNVNNVIALIKNFVVEFKES